MHASLTRPASETNPPKMEAVEGRRFPSSLTRRRGPCSTLVLRAASALLVAGAMTIARASSACSSCGCTLSSDWASQGYTAGPGFHLDLRFDYFNQDQLRSGTGTVNRSTIQLPNAREIQQETVNRDYSLILDYSPTAEWGVNLQVPYFDRYHTTIAPGDTEISTSHTESLGDVRIVGRYQGLSPDNTTGLQFGLKLATGSIQNDFIGGPQSGTPVDRGLQPGTGITDLLVGVYHFGALARSWDYFAQALVDQPLSSREGFKPGTGLNVNLGVRYVANQALVPQIQLNAHAEGRESGANADVDNSGATLVYIGPGVTVSVAKDLKAYAFVQVPVYQNVNGYQIEPRFTVSAGLHYNL